MQTMTRAPEAPTTRRHVWPTPRCTLWFVEDVEVDPCGTDVEPEHVGAEETKTTTSSEPEVPQGINCLVCKYMIYEYITYMIYDAVLLIMICY